METKAVFGNNKYVHYGDQAYGEIDLLLSSYPGRPQELPLHQQKFNISMRNLRVAVEWGFQKVVSEFAFVDFKKKMLLEDIEDFLKCAVLFSNCHTCLYGGQINAHFNVEKYLGVI